VKLENYRIWVNEGYCRVSLTTDGYFNIMKNIIRTMLFIIAGAGLFWAGTVDAYDQAIYDAQIKLEELGYDPGKPDGIRGKKTVTAIKLFQEDSGLPATGRLDALTKARLNAQRAPSQFSLNEAVQLNDIVLVKALLDSGSDINERDELGETPLHTAAVGGYGEIASLLIAKGADVNARDVRGLTPLHAAAWMGYPNLVALLIEHGADINARDKDRVTPLHTAALAGRQETVAMLIEQGADINAKNKNSLTPLHAAAMAGDRDTVALLINKGADVNAKSKDGLTPLHMASQQNHREVVELLRKHRPQE
jgi:ankyrin repeat protein